MKKLTWLVLLLGIQSFCLASSRAWAQSGITQQNGRQVTCASDDGKRHLCRVDTSRGVQMINQRSGSPCIQGQTWGYSRQGIWVDSRLPGGFLPGDWLETRRPRRTRRTFWDNHHLLPPITANGFTARQIPA